MLVSQSELFRILREWESRYWSVPPAEVSQRAERFRVKWKVRVGVVNKSSPNPLAFDNGQAINISATGLGLITRHSISPGDWCLCLLHVPEPNAPFVVLGQAIWQTPVNAVFATGVELVLWQNEKELDQALWLAKKEEQSAR
ncbi:MAG: PilZ domain-containing protein [Candidatus Poribacteria bacterium]|nr:PilZ domain-containing protein [Candidatus Poribacteria bacterium]